MEKEINRHGAVEPIELITGRELEVLQLVTYGLTGPEIASKLSIAIKTFETHKENIGNIGIERRMTLRKNNSTRAVISGLIIDGIRSGYLSHNMAESTFIESFTPREYEVALLSTQALTQKEIGELLRITERTVESHKEHIYNKLGGINSHYPFVARFTCLQMRGFFKEHEERLATEEAVFRMI